MKICTLQAFGSLCLGAHSVYTLITLSTPLIRYDDSLDCVGRQLIGQCLIAKDINQARTVTYRVIDYVYLILSATQ